MTLEQLSQRVTTLEAEVAELKAYEKLRQAHTKLTWIDKVSGSMKDYPEFSEVVRLGKEWRDAQCDESDQNSHTGAGAA